MTKAQPVQVQRPAFVEDPLNFLIYSPAGQGKTVFLASGADDQRFWPGLIADFEGGIRSIKSKTRYVRLPSDRDSTYPALGTDLVPGKIDVVRIRTWEDFDALYEYLTSEENPYKMVAIDSLSELNYLNLTEVTQAAIEADTKHDPDVPEQRDYLRSQTQMRKLIRYFRDLPIHTGFSAGVMEVEDPRTKKRKNMPSLTGKLVNEIPGLVDYVAYLAIVEEGDQVFRALCIQPQPAFMAKARDEFGVLGDMVENPTLPKIMDLLEAGQPGTPETAGK